MVCWENCGYRWREVGDTSSCIRYVNDETVTSTRLTVEVIAIRIDPNWYDPEVELFYHEFDGVVKIYELYVGDTVETLVYENVDTFYFNRSNVYYKHVEWRANFVAVNDDPDEVDIGIRSKELCPDCEHPYVCDCEDSILIGRTTTTVAPDPTHNYISKAETMIVELLEIDLSGTRVNIDIKIHSNELLKYHDTRIIDVGEYFDIYENVLNYYWRINCNEINFGLVTFQLCHSYTDSGEGSGSTGAGLVAAQYFDSTSFGWTCGCVIHVVVDNPLSGYGDNTVPTEVRLDVHAWQGSYLATKSAAPLTTQTMITPTETMNNDPYWIPFMWDIDLPPGEYMWVLTCLHGPHDGSFRLVYINYAPYQRDQAFVNGYPHRDFYSRIVGITTDESYQKVISKDDTFKGNYYIGIDGYSKIKVKNDTGYKNTMTTGHTHCDMRRDIGIVGGENLSFETGDFTDWDIRSYGDTSVTVSDYWASNGTYSAKFVMPAWCGESVMISQHLDSTVLLPGWKLMWDTYAEGAGTYWLNIFVDGWRYEELVVNGEIRNMSVNIGTSASYLRILMEYQCCNIYYNKVVYIDNIRFVPPGESAAPVGRVVGGSSNIRYAG